MKWCFNNLFSLSAFIVALALIPTSQTAAQTLTALHNFNGTTDGGTPNDGLILSGNTLYGTAETGGTGGSGTVFRVNTDGTGFMTLHSFQEEMSGDVNGDGGNPVAGLVLSGNTLYGTAWGGGPYNQGTVFAVNTDGTGFSLLHIFYDTTNNDGMMPYGGLVLSGNTLYGTTEVGGSSGGGTVFRINTDGTGYGILYDFIGPTDGDLPIAELAISGNTLYGTTKGGGPDNYGTIFKINTDGSGFSSLHYFTSIRYSAFNSDGAMPEGGLILAGNTLYGTTAAGGAYGGGDVYAVNTDGTGFTNLYSFPGGTVGANPAAGLLLVGNTLYGTTTYAGAMFSINTNGMGATYLGLGYTSYGGLILAGNTFYGTIINNNGTSAIVSVSYPAPQLTISFSGTNPILAWPTGVAQYSYSGYSLWSANTLNPTAWNPVSPAPVIVNGRYTITNAVPGAQMFYRLSQ